MGDVVLQDPLACHAHTIAAVQALREKALAVPTAMQGCLDLEPEEMLLLKKLLDKALIRMDLK